MVRYEQVLPARYWLTCRYNGIVFTWPQARMTLARQWLGTRVLLFIAAFAFAAPALPETYYTVLFPATVGNTKELISCAGAPAQYLVYNTTNNLLDFAAISLEYSGSLNHVVKGDSGWIPYSASFTSSNYGDVKQGVSTLSSSGTLTTNAIETYTPIGASTVAYTSYVYEKIDLNTGKYNSHWDDVYTPEAPCGSGVSDEIAKDQSGVVALIFSPIAPPLSLAFVNPYACVVDGYSCTALPSFTSGVLTNQVRGAPGALAISTDDKSAAVLVVTSTDSIDPVNLTLAGPGSLGPYSPTFIDGVSGRTSGWTALCIPTPKTSCSSGTGVPVATPASCDENGRCIFLAILWPPGSMSGSVVAQPITISAAQNGLQSQAMIQLVPPPVMLVHGVWSSGTEAWPSFYPWLATNYPQKLISVADYKDSNYKAYFDPATQFSVGRTLSDLLAFANGDGVISRQVDVVAHSMGGLVTEYLIQHSPPDAPSWWPSTPVRQLVTIGTPYDGTPLASLLGAHQTDLPAVPIPQPLSLSCATWLNLNGGASGNCTLGNLFASLGKPVDAAVQYMIPGNQPAGTGRSKPIVGLASPCSLAGCSPTELMFDLALSAFFPGQTESSIFTPQAHDTLVSESSQAPTTPIFADQGVVHTSLCGGCAGEIGETSSQAFWEQAATALVGGSAAAPVQWAQSTVSGFRKGQYASALSSPPILDLTGYTQVPSSNVTFLPSSGAALTIGAPASITLTSATKTITELLLFQIVSDPTDVPLMYNADSPFAVEFIPTRLGGTTFTAFALFSDNTFAMSTLTYTFSPVDVPISLSLINVPMASLPVGASTKVGAQALFTNSSVDVSSAATFSVRSGSTSVFSVNSGGGVSANAPGTDWLEVSYSGLTASAQVSVGACTFDLTPNIQLVTNAGGGVSIQTASQTGCDWTADSGGATWLAPVNMSGSGSGTVTLTAAPNSTGATRTAVVTVARRSVAIVQPAISCAYVADQTPVTVPGSGGGGSIGVTSSCQIVASSGAQWLNAVALANAVAYSAPPNNTGAARSAILTIGTAPVNVSQPVADLIFNDGFE